jgi:hypothetical protein
MQTIQTSSNGIAAAVMTAMVLAGTPLTVHAEDAAPASTLMTDEARSEMREQIKRELLADMKGRMAEEIRRELVAELKSQMTEEVKRQLMVEMKSQMAEDIKRQVLADLTGAGSAGAATAPADKSKPRVVRVPYVPESMRREIREQVKQEVLAQAKEERWGNPGALPGWIDRFHFVGDVRVRADWFRLAKDNSAPGVANYGASGMTRAADLVGANGNYAGVPNVNTQEDFDRTRLRLRFGATVKVADTVSAGFQISTGNTTGPTSTNQTMGQGFNKYSLVLDRGYVTVAPSAWLSLTGGRMPNPFFGTDLVWADDLNFEGFAARYARPLTPDLTGFIAAGWFPLRTDNPLQSSSRDLKGLQAGFDWHFAPTADFKLGAAIYQYRGLEGQLESDDRYGPPSASDYGTRYEYPNGLRQRGNTLFITNALADSLSGTTYWGLASGFREFNLTGSLDLARFDPVHLVLTGDYVKNLAFDRNKIAERTGSTIVDGKDHGYQAKLTVGYPEMTRWGDWNVSLAYRWLGSDAVLDAFTNSDFGMGGTNNKGYILGGSYGIDKNAWISARWMASQLIDSMAPAIAGSATAPTKLKVDLFQIDLNAKF